MSIQGSGSEHRPVSQSSQQRPVSPDAKNATQTKVLIVVTALFGPLIAVFGFMYSLGSNLKTLVQAKIEHTRLSKSVDSQEGTATSNKLQALKHQMNATKQSLKSELKQWVLCMLPGYMAYKGVQHLREGKHLSHAGNSERSSPEVDMTNTMEDAVDDSHQSSVNKKDE